MTAGTVQLEHAGAEGVSLVRIDRPDKRNALDDATRQALLDVMEGAIEEGSRVLVLTGSEGTFASGADLAEMRDRTVEEQRSFISPPRMYERIEGLSAPVIAAVNGHALGAGLELALACDVRLASASAKLGSPEVKLGIIPGGGATQRLPRLVGLGQAMRLVLTGEIVEAQQAEELGIVQATTPEGESVEQAIELAAQMAENSAVALSAAKRALRASWRKPLAEGLQAEIDQFCRAFASHDADEGITAFLEKRDPVFEHG